ncbi:MAG: saccharopine dehydrogenase NADP-binding domain-containing protein [Syntrophorhabdaceae bacterium]|nr:saccharopine dehydrogenase NADP-binding domain-containing protein [Syntrophorhabdaceae bacterium]
MRVLILGGAGGMGQGVARDLIKQESVKKVVLGDINTDPDRINEKLRSSQKVSLEGIDINDRASLMRLMKEVDVVINCAGPFYKTAIPVASVAVEAKVNYIDICDDYEATKTLFESHIDREAKDAGITVLTGMGSDPGTNNVLVKWYADKLDKVDEISLFWIVSIAEIQGAAWDHSLHMVLGKVPQFIEGKIEYVEGGTGEEVAEFLEPLGVCKVRYVGHPQPLTIPRYIKGVKKVEIKGALIPSWVDELILLQKETGFLGTEPLNIRGNAISPYEVTLKLWERIPEKRDRGPQASGLKVIVKGERDGKGITYTADMVGRMAPGTGLPASIAALMMYEGLVKEKGVVAPEGCIEPERFIGEMIKRGARIHQSEKITSILTF